MAKFNAKLITDPEQAQQFYRNVAAMRERFFQPPLAGEDLYLLRRKLEENSQFSHQLEQALPILHEGLTGPLLPSWNTIYRHTRPGESPTLKTVRDVAAFCSLVFDFSAPLTAEELLTRELAPFPPLSQKKELWGRYTGLYRCFYFYPDFPEGHTQQPQLHGGLLKLWEENKCLFAFYLTGIRRDTHFQELEALVAAAGPEELLPLCQAYSDRLPDYELRLVCYGGSVSTDTPRYFHMALRRLPVHLHHNTAFLLLRRWDASAQLLYSGGIGGVTLCRGTGVSCHAAAITRQPLTFDQDGDFVAHYLRAADTGAKGLQITHLMEENWNRALMERIRQQQEQAL